MDQVHGHAFERFLPGIGDGAADGLAAGRQGKKQEGEQAHEESLPTPWGYPGRGSDGYEESLPDGRGSDWRRRLAGESACPTVSCHAIQYK
jgi:hypothetical protein